MDKKITPVEWLEKEFIKLESTVGVHGVMYELIDQARSKEKDNMIAFANYYAEYVTGGGKLTPTEYYETNFKC